jgi:hypothetical protein
MTQSLAYRCRTRAASLPVEERFAYATSTLLFEVAAALDANAKRITELEEELNLRDMEETEGGWKFPQWSDGP